LGSGVWVGGFRIWGLGFMVEDLKLFLRMIEVHLFFEALGVTLCLRTCVWRLGFGGLGFEFWALGSGFWFLVVGFRG
jgi:hypothetical protein